MKYYYVTICSILTRIVLNSLSKSCGGFEQRPNTNHFNKITKNNQHAPRIQQGGQFDNFCKIGKLYIANRSTTGLFPLEEIILKYIYLLIDGHYVEINIPKTSVASFVCIIDFVCMYAAGGRAAFQWRDCVTLVLGPS